LQHAILSEAEGGSCWDHSSGPAKDPHIFDAIESLLIFQWWIVRISSLFAWFCWSLQKKHWIAASVLHY